MMVARKIGLLKTSMILINASCSSWPISFENKFSRRMRGYNRCMGSINNPRIDTWHGKTSKSSFSRSSIFWCRYHDTPCFRLPPGIDDMTLLFSDIGMIPIPGISIDRFSNASKNLERRKYTLWGIVISHGNKRTKGSWCSIETIYFIFLDNFPIPCWRRKCRNSFEKYDCATIQEWSVGKITMPRDPTDIRRWEKYISWCASEYHFRGIASINHISTKSMHDSLRFSGRS